MKKIIALVIIIAALQSCAPGKWVGGNQKHFDQRAAVKAKKATISIK